MIKPSFKNSNLNEGNLKKRRCFRKGAIYMNEGLVLKDFSYANAFNEFICDKRKRDVLHC